MKPHTKSVVICAALICLAVVLWMAIGNGRSQTKVTYSQFLQQVRAGQVANVVIVAGSSGATQATCRLKDGVTVRTVLPSDYRDAMAAMQDKLVNIEIQDSSAGRLKPLANATPFLLLLALWVFMLRRLPNGPRQGRLG